MSSRALRKLRGGDDILIDGLPAGGDSEEETPYPVVSKSKKKKKKKGVNIPDNPFDLLDNAEAIDEDCMANGDAQVEEPEEECVSLSTDSGQSKKKKKKKKKKDKSSPGGGAAEDALTPVDGSTIEDEIEASIREVNAILGELPAGPADDAANALCPTWARLQPLLTIEHKNLNPTIEMKKKFGSQVVQAEGRSNRNHRRPHKRPYWLVQPKDTWPHMAKSGLTMELEETKGGVQYFRIEHSTAYQQVQCQFWDAVDSLNPQNIVQVLNTQSHHIDSLLQLSEVCRMSEDVGMATDLIERALHCFECNFHTLFNLTQGNCRLDYRRPENRAFYLAFFRHLTFVGQKGCYRTALEFCKLLLSLDPEGDPLGVLLMIDFYALRSEEYSYLIRMYHDWEAERNLTQLPNFAFSLALAMFMQSQQEGADTPQADQALQKALLMFPGLLVPLLDKCGVNPDASVTKHPFFGPEAQNNQPAALKQLVSLYVGRCHSCWKEPEVVYWLERNVKETLCRVDACDPLVKSNVEKRRVRYQGMPRNILRHILIAEVKDATAALPPDVANTPVMSYDPLPPLDSINSYTRPARPRRIDQDNNALTLFFRSLLPNFNPQELAAEVEGAAGGQAPPADLRQGINGLMDAMRDLLNNIQPVPPPVENREEPEEPGPGEWD